MRTNGESSTLPLRGARSAASGGALGKIWKPTVTYDAQRRATTSIYNARGELIRTEYADTTAESTAYDAEGRREYHTDRRSKVSVRPTPCLNVLAKG